MSFERLIDGDVFFEITKNFEIVPYVQTKGMCDMHSLSGNNRIVFFINDFTKPTIACFGHEKKFLTKKMLLIEGECYATSENINIKEVHTFYSNICQESYDIIEICSNTQYNFIYETALRQAGYLRPVGQFSMPITKIIDLTDVIKYNQNWKRNIKKSTGFNLTFEFIESPNLTDCTDFILIYKEMIGRKSMSNSLNSNQILALCKDPNFNLSFSSCNHKRVSGILIHKNTTHAGLFYAATNEIALKSSASFFMYNSLFKHLNTIGIKTFDMEKLVPSTQSVNSVFLFKNGIEGKHVVLNGEWSWYKKSYYRPLMYFVKKHLMKKREL